LSEKVGLDRPVGELLKMSWEKVSYCAILVVALVSRFWDLGARAMSHDESLHALYSYYLYNGTGYQHNPMMHGPFLFHANALIYFLFGDSDTTARIVPALFGVFLVMSPLLLRRWLGRMGAMVTSLLLLISPLTLYYSRYIRNDVYIAVWTILLVAALFHLLRDRKQGWFTLGAAVLMLSLATKEVAYIFGFIGLAFVVEVLLWERLRTRSRPWLYVGGAVLSILLLVAGALLARAAASAAAATEGAGKVEKLLGALVTVVGGTIPAMLLSSTLIPSRHPRPSRVEEVIRSLPRRAWIIAIVVMLLIYSLLFTTFFTNPAGLITGIGGSISYWLAQQEVERGGQPWYYYLLLLPMYEFLPLLFSLVAMAFYLIRGQGGGSRNGDKRLEPLLPEAGDARLEPLPREEEDARPEPLPPEGDGAGGRREQLVFVAFLVFWTITTLFIYTWAGEKMPWLGVHPLLPMIVLTGLFVGNVFEEVDWREVWRRGGAWLALLLPVTVFGVYVLGSKRPFQGMSLSKLQETGTWLAALLITVLLLVLTGLVMRRLGRRYSGLVAVGTLLGVLGLFTVRTAWMAAYINYDYATELLVYAHGAADVVPTMDEIADISRRTVGDKTIEVAYDNEVTWPLEWYFREYPNRKYYGDSPTREQMSVPIVLFSERNDSKVRPYLGDRFYCFKRRLVWWPNQQYMDLTWKQIGEILGSPEKREILWNILYWRTYPKTPAEWYHVHNFNYCVRKDVAQQIWGFGAVPPEAVELPPDAYAQARVELQAERVWGSVGTGPGQFNHPRGVAVGPDGRVYVVDSDNGRVQVFDAEGGWLREWGSPCELQSGQGCVDPDGDGPLEVGDGQFKEPWGIAVGGDGRVYVADTWNHRIQVFDAKGVFVAKWGTFGQTTALDSVLYGPRDVAVDATGRVLVSDTGNKRVLAFDADGTPVEQFGGGGAAQGNFEEPVGIGVDAGGDIYIADTWNQRVQVFDSRYIFLREWQVDAWYGQSVVNKPYLAVDARGRVYVTDPEGYGVDVFGQDGEVVATFGMYGVEEGAFSLPTGIDVDDQGRIYVTDTDGQRVMRFGALP